VLALLLVAALDQTPPAAASPASAATPSAAATAAPAAPAEQIAAAVLAAPADRRAAAAVLGYDEKGALVTLREGSNDQICLADNPKENGVSVACYHKDLEPFMARGRELDAQGLKGKERTETRYKEIESGKLPLPKEPRTLYVLHGSGFDAATGQVQNAYVRWVVYTPYATPESTGLSTKPAENAPWLMDGGTPGAHIMITPPRPKKP
jgi:hypothetical protein